MFRQRLSIRKVFGITFEQGRNELNIDKDFFSDVVTENKEIPEQAKIDLSRHSRDWHMRMAQSYHSDDICFFV